jgi:ABC-type branched-subunit amino acid transport system ATPase component
MSGPHSTAAPLLAVEKLTRRFGGLVAVNDVSFVVRPGQIKGLIGPNGAGKTTCFNLIAGVIPPSAGRVTLAGEPIERLPPHQRVARGLARTFQNLQIFREMTVLENVMLGMHSRLGGGFVGAMLRTPRTRADERRAADEALAALGRVGLADRAARPAANLSFGECKILEIARALVARPKLLLLDEPMAGLPHESVVQVEQVVRELRGTGITVLLVEHNMGLVMRLCDEIAVLDHGELIAEGPPAAIRADRNVIRAYLGEEPLDA